MPNSDAGIVADAHFRASLAIGRFIADDVAPLVRSAVDRSDPLQDTCAAYLDRVGGWLRSVGKLNQTSDFQAIDAAARSLFEIVIDLTVLLHDRTCPVQKMVDWEQWARFKRDKNTVEVLSGTTDTHELARLAIAEGRVQNFSGFISTLRAKWRWPRFGRWTGRDLFADAEQCDKLTSSEHGKHYRLRFMELCWNTHGSAFAGLRGLDERAITAGVMQSLEDVSILSRAAAELILDLLGLRDAPANERFTRLDRECERAMHEALAVAGVSM